MEGENGSERENKCKLTPRYEKTPGSRVPREEKPVKKHVKNKYFCNYISYILVMRFRKKWIYVFVG